MTPRRALTLALTLCLYWCWCSGLPAATGAGSIEVERFEAGERHDVRLPGKIESFATARTQRAGRTLVLLVRPPVTPVAEPAECPEDDTLPPTLWSVDLPPDGDAKLRRLRRRVPANTHALDAADLDGDGIDELLLGTPGSLLSLRDPTGLSDDTPDAVLTDEALDRASLHPDLVTHVAGQAPWLVVPAIGLTRFYRVDPEASAWEKVAEIPLRTGLSWQPHGLVVSSPMVRAIGKNEAGRPLFATAVQAVGEQRLQVTLFDPAHTDPDSRQVDCWARLPQPEWVIEQLVGVVDGRPILVVTTMPKGRLNFFGEKQLRVFPLARDRSRSGLPPALARETRINIWQTAELFLHDVDGDGRPDLVLAYWKGLKDDRLVFDVYAGNEATGFAPQPRTTGLDVKQADRSYIGFGEDLDGDGNAEVTLRADGRLLVLTGLDAPTAKPLFERRKSRSIPLAPEDPDPAEGDDEEEENEVVVRVGADGTMISTGVSREPLTTDLDGDGRIELVLVDDHRDGNGTVRIFRLD